MRILKSFLWGSLFLLAVVSNAFSQTYCSVNLAKDYQNKINDFVDQQLYQFIKDIAPGKGKAIPLTKQGGYNDPPLHMTLCGSRALGCFDKSKVPCILDQEQWNDVITQIEKSGGFEIKGIDVSDHKTKKGIYNIVLLVSTPSGQRCMRGKIDSDVKELSSSLHIKIASFTHDDLVAKSNTLSGKELSLHLQNRKAHTLMEDAQLMKVKLPQNKKHIIRCTP